MNVLHTISGMNITSGGPSLSTYMLVTGLRAAGVSAEILAYANTNPQEQVIADDAFINFLPAPVYPRLGYSRALQKFFLSTPDVDLYHAHGLWQYCSHATAQFARSANKPYMISTRGMLYPEALKKSPLFKKVAEVLFQKKDLQRASCIHATCEQEYKHIRACGITKPPIAIIPNSIELKTKKVLCSVGNQKKRVGFVGRFTPIKNIESLIQAWAVVAAGRKEWELVLVGDGEQGYRSSLERLAFKKLGLSNVVFTGFLSGREKDDMFASFRCLVLPSKSENFGMVVAEALAQGIPVIASKGTPWQELSGSAITEKCGWWVDHGAGALKQALTEMMSFNEEKLSVMGVNGHKLIEFKYSISVVSRKMIKLYEWLLLGGQVPDCVRVE